MLEKLKSLNVDRLLDMEEAVALSAYARGLESEYRSLELPIPEWLEKACNVLREEIARRTRAGALAELKEIESRIEGYKSVSEKRSEDQKRLNDLQKRLGISPVGSRK